MSTVQSWMPAVLSFALAACSVSQNLHEGEIAAQSEALSGQVKPTSTYYTVRHDFRRCASPMCGGYFVAAVNQARTRCADGSQAAECYVAELAHPEGIEIKEGALVHGALVARSYPGIQGRWGVLEADFVASPVLAGARAGQHVLAYDTGIRCITTPCPTLGVVALNVPGPTSKPDVAFVAGTKDENAQLEQTFFDELGTTAEAGTGALAVGTLRKRFDRRSRRWVQTLNISNVYRVEEPPSPTCLVLTNSPTTTAWNFSTRDEASTFASTLDGDVQLLDSACDDAWLPCTAQYNPVHGQIDALGDVCVGASNACGFRAAVIHAAGHESKATGSFLKGQCPSGSGCELMDCQPGNTCIEDDQGNGSCVVDACATVRCRAGTHCELEQVQCFAAPCNPIAQCVADAECTGPIIDCAAPPPGCNYVGGGCVDGRWTCGGLVCDGNGI